MSHRKGAFTLIELLVVIAIIAILAAILFPVFAQAKAAAKASVSLSNTKQIGVSQQMYLSDNDDVFPLRRFCTATTPKTIYSWKQAQYPYSKSTQIFTDPVNPSAKYLDDTSSDLILAADGYALNAQTGLKQFARGYAMNNINFYIDGQWDNFGPCDGAKSGFYLNTLNQGAIDQVAGVAALVETKMQWVDTGSYINWGMAGTPGEYKDDDGVTRYSGWNWGGGKWDDKAQSIVYMDSHAKRTSNGTICTNKGDDPTIWGWSYNGIKNHAPGGDMTWLDTFCQTRPAGF
jgi:prepilin-type N-terminal cleavage/methylation domain-containing protein